METLILIAMATFLVLFFTVIIKYQNQNQNSVEYYDNSTSSHKNYREY